MNDKTMEKELKILELIYMGLSNGRTKFFSPLTDNFESERDYLKFNLPAIEDPAEKF